MDYDIVEFHERINEPGFSLLEALPEEAGSLPRPTPSKVIRLLNACVPHLPGQIAESILVKALVDLGYMESSVRKNYLTYLKKVRMFKRADRGRWELTPEFIEKVMNKNGTKTIPFKKDGPKMVSRDTPTVTNLESLDNKARIVWEYLLAKSNPTGKTEHERELKSLNCKTFDHKEAFTGLKEEGVVDSIEFRSAICLLESRGVILTKLSGDNGALTITLYPDKMVSDNPEPPVTVKPETGTVAIAKNEPKPGEDSIIHNALELLKKKERDYDKQIKTHQERVNTLNEEIGDLGQEILSLKAEKNNILEAIGSLIKVSGL